MVKTVGKIFVFFLSVTIFSLDANVSMEIRTDGGMKGCVVVGQPFILDIVINDLSGSIQAPIIKGLERFGAKRTGTYMSSINGKSTTRYSYQVRIDEVGSYTLGPAVITHQKKDFVSNEVAIVVAKDLGSSTVPDKKDSQAVSSKSFLRLMIDTQTAVVGQKIGCTLRFYYQDPSISLHNIGIPELPNFDIKEIGKLESGIAEVDGSTYRYAQWRWDMYPTKFGEFIIPAYHADYDVPTKDNHMFSGLFMFVGSRADRRRVYSNAVILKVSSLPHHDDEVHAVGLFKRISAEVKPASVKEGEGMVFTLEIEGNGNLQAIKVPVLNMPQSLKYYDSRSDIIAPQHDDQLPRKKFEFIVQGMQPGDYEIPEQLFTYFDIEKNAYTTLSSVPLSVSIIPNAAAAQKDIGIAIDHSLKMSKVWEQHEGIADINLVGEWYPVTSRRPLPWWLFQILFLIPCLYLGLRFSLKIAGESAWLMRRRAFKQARKEIELSIKSTDDKNLHTIFTSLFQQLKESHDLADGTTVLRQHGLSDKMITEWDDFLHRITHAAYAQLRDKDTDELCRMAQQWIERLEKIM